MGYSPDAELFVCHVGASFVNRAAHFLFALLESE